MAAVLALIPQQNFEIIRNKIVSILHEELQEQHALDSTFTAPASISIERFFEFDKSTQIPAINVCFHKGEYGDKMANETRGDYHFYIDCYTNSATIGTDRGDKLAAYKLMQLMGKVRAILENPSYKTLSTTGGAIKGTAVKQMMVVYKEQDPTALNDIVGRVVFCVRATEDSSLLTALNLLQSGSTAKLYETAQGYYFGVPPDTESTGTPDAITINNGGTGYVVYDYVYIDGGDGLSVVVVLAVDVNGAVTNSGLFQMLYHTYTLGTGYTIGTNIATINGVASGTGFTVDITSIIPI